MLQRRIGASYLLFGALLIVSYILATGNRRLVAPTWGGPQQVSGSELTAQLWPGSFLTSAGNSRSVDYVAGQRSYSAQVFSSGFVVRLPGKGGDSVALQFVGARENLPSVRSVSTGSTLTTIVDDPAGRTYDRARQVEFAGAYEGIDVVFRDTVGRLEVDFVVAPHASTDDIVLSAGDHTSVELDPATGDAVLANGDNVFRLHAPVAYQDRGSTRTFVPVSFVLEQEALTFEVGTYDRSLPLVIDPLVQAYSTFIGAMGDAFYDEVRAIATDSNGNIYLAGRTNFDRSNPLEPGFPRGDSNLELLEARTLDSACYFGCGYIAKLSPQHRLLYTVLVRELDFRSVAVDANGSAYATGTGFTNSPFPITANNLGATNGTFVLKVNPAGTALSYFGFFPAGDAWGIAVDSQGSAYVVGSVEGPVLNTTPGSLKATYQPNAVGFTNKDGYLIKVDPQGVNVVYATYLGGYEDDVARAVTVTPDGRAIVVGNTQSNDFVGIPGASSGFDDVFVLDVSASGATALHGRILGGAGSDSCLAIVRNTDGGYFIGGATQSADFPVTAGVVQSRLLGARDGWIARLDASLGTVFATYYGGSSFDGVQGLAADSAGNVYFTGISLSSDLQVNPDASQSVSSHYMRQFPILDESFYRFSTVFVRDSFMAGLSSNGQSLVYSTYLGAMSSDFIDDPTTFGNAMVVAPDGTIYVAGTTLQTPYPVTADALYSTFRGGSEGFLSAWRPGNLLISTSSGLPTVIKDAPSYSVQLSATGGTPPYSWALVSGQLPYGLSLANTGRISGVNTTHLLPNGAVAPFDSGSQFTVRVQDALGAITHKQFFLYSDSSVGITCSANVCSAAMPKGQSFTTLPFYLSRAVPPVSLSAPDGLPAGFSLTNDGTLDAKLNSAGVFVFRIVATDSVGNSATVRWQITVNDPSAPPPAPPPPSTPPPPATPSLPSTSDGGGGAFDFVLGALLASLLCLELGRRRRTNGLMANEFH